VHEGEADGLMKGKVSTPGLLKAVLNKKYNLRTDRLLSHIALMEIPSYHKLLLFTDGGMVITPNLEQKVGILLNGVQVMQGIGVQRPKVAVLAAIEKVNADMPETVDAEKLVQMARRGELGKVEVEGPMAMDIAMSPEAARLKGFESQISGDPDILLMPNISAGNISAKALWHLAGAKIAGLIVGARKPIVLLSRSDDAVTKLNSIALAVVAF
jgi:phosphate butyryltransferase